MRKLALTVAVLAGCHWGGPDPPPNALPSVTAGADQTSREVGVAFQFSAVVSDADGAVEKVVWDFGDGTGATGLQPPAFGVSHAYAQEGSFTVTATVVDDRGGTAEDQVDVVVTPTFVDLIAGGVGFNCDPAYTGEENPVQVTIGRDGSSAAPAFSYEIKLMPGETVVLTAPVVSLEPGETYDQEVQVPLPGGLTEGMYTLSLEVDSAGEVAELDEGNNSVESLSPVLVRARDVDISVDSVAAAQHVVSIGEPLQADVTFSNSGLDPVPGFDFAAYLSADTVYSGDDVLVDTVSVAGIAASGTAAASLDSTVPAGVTEGSDYYLLALADPSDLVSESDEDNNTGFDPGLISVRGADIAVDSVAAAQYAVSIGEALQGDVAFSNSGLAAVPGFDCAVYLSADTVYSGDDVLVDTLSVAGIAAEGTAAASLDSTVPVGVTAGNAYYLMARADPTDLVSETDEDNNTGFDPVPIVIGRRKAVVVGVSLYLEPAIPDLSYCDDDAIAFRDALLAAGEWDPADVELLTNQFAYKADIMDAIANAGAELSAGDTFVFSFSGHGGYGFDVAPLDEGDAFDEYICPYDSDEFVWSNDIRDDELEQWLQGYIPAGVRICVIIDACNSGGMGKGKPGTGSLAAGLADDFRRRAKDIDNLSPLVGLFASAETEVSWEDGALGHGVFSRFVLDAFDTPSADADSNGWFSAEEVFDYAEPLTYDWTNTYYFPDVQNPEIVDNCTGELELRTTP